MKNEAKFLGWMVFALVIISGCQASATAPTKTLQPISPPLIPFQVKTNTPTVTATPIILPTEQPLFPSPTPFKHVIQPGDTMYGIALKYNISLDRLVSANPGINTGMLTVGTQLNIPFESDEDLSIPTPTPYPVSVSIPTCLLTNDGGMWCFSD
ncbi:MAG: LysM peptidoglycan-binding domain-containing protein, partial [Anaerolineales bacterium]|nr:LysM peptidoglycan-binding domain-containing protein [Anaerolineales bacterium]